MQRLHHLAFACLGSWSSEIDRPSGRQSRTTSLRRCSPSRRTNHWAGLRGRVVLRVISHTRFDYTTHPTIPLLLHTRALREIHSKDRAGGLRALVLLHTGLTGTTTRTTTTTHSDTLWSSQPRTPPTLFKLILQALQIPASQAARDKRTARAATGLYSDSRFWPLEYYQYLDPDAEERHPSS